MIVFFITLILFDSVVVKTFFRSQDQDQDLGRYVSMYHSSVIVSTSNKLVQFIFILFL